MIFKRLIVVLLLTFFATNLSISEEVKTGEHQINVFTGNFDFSDDKQKAILVGFQHQNENLNRDTCIISTRNDGIKYFLKQQDICFKPFKDLHKKNKRPFYVALIERTINKGLPNNCNLRQSYSTKINFSKEDIVVAKIFECS